MTVSFVAEKQSDNSWLILRVGDDIYTPDTTPTVTLALDSASIDEDGGVATVTATLSAAASAAVEVTVSVSPDSGASTGDYTLSQNRTLTFWPGQTTSTGTVTITAVDNDDDAPDKTVSGTATGGGGVSNPASQTLTITDDDDAPVDDGDDFGQTTATAGAVEVGRPIAGEIEESGDQDWFRVTLKAGQDYRIDLEGRDTDSGTLDNPLLVGVYDAGGNWVDGTWDDDGGIGQNSRVIITPESGGIYYISAGGRHSFDRGSYTLSIVEETGGVSADPDAAATVEADGLVSGESGQPEESDWSFLPDSGAIVQSAPTAEPAGGGGGGGGGGVDRRDGFPDLPLEDHFTYPDAISEMQDLFESFLLAISADIDAA